MKKVAVVGLHTIKNAGDVVLCDVTGHLIQTLCPGTEIVRVDVNKVTRRFTGRWKSLKKARAFFFRALQRVDRDLFAYRNKSRFRYAFEYAMWYLQNHRMYKRQLSDVDAIVFAGGGFLKFRTQGLNYHVEQIIRFARKRNIPVMMNGVGIEGYDDNDIRCQRLKAMINEDCVKVITTRDNIEILQDNYIENENIITARVGDPALWVKECYSEYLIEEDSEDEETSEDGDYSDEDDLSDEEAIPMADDGAAEDDGPAEDDAGEDDPETDSAEAGGAEETEEEPAKLIGINVIRGNVYKDYGNSLSEFELLNFYKQLIRELDARGLEWQLFSNGMKADNSFGQKLLKSLHIKKKKVVVPPTAVRFCKCLKHYDCVIGARLHACIIAYALDIPVVGFIWNDKTRFFSEVTGRREFYFDETQLSAKDIADGVLASMEKPYDTGIREELRQLTIKHLTYFVENFIGIEETDGDEAGADGTTDESPSGASNGADRSKA